MDLKLAGHTAVIVGGARGIGRAIAGAFAAEGAALALIDRDARVTQTATELAGRSLAIIADVRDYAALQRASEQIAQSLGRIDHVVFAVAVGSGKYGFPFWNLEPGDWPHVFEVNVQGAVNTAHVFAPALVRQQAGTMLFLSSIAGQIGSQTDPPYSASKAALINFAQCAAKDLAKYKVRVNTVCPGMVRTDLNRSVWEAWHRLQPPERRQSYEEWSAEKIERLVPLGRWQEAEDVAAMAVFLASDAGRNITGQTINVDGGFVMHW
jgi:NAD(P)-dependent dehydrogenase (short-subunit alcohol dehydrogenase family)